VLVRDFLEHSADRLPGKVALVCGNHRFTYAELDAQANQLANALIANGVQRGDRVVIHLPNTVNAVVSIFAVLKAGAVFVPINATTKADKLNFILNNCRAVALISDLRGQPLPYTPWLKAVIVPELATHAKTASVAFYNFEELKAAASATRPLPLNAEDDLACLIYTSGSTGQPKGVMSEHRNVVFATGSIIQYLENTESDIVLNVSPLSFDYGLYQLLMTFRFGGTLVLENSFAFPSLVLQRLVEERVTGFPGVPTIFSLLLAQDLRAFDLSHLRYLTNTAAALPPNHVLEIQKKFPHAKLFSMYGLTETKRTLYMPPDKLEQRPGSVGIPIPGTEVWLEDEEGRRLGPGKVGELVVKGPHVMRGYWENPDATAKRFRTLPNGDRVCYSGDLFKQDSDGYFYFIGRKDDIIKSRGEKVAPKEVENILYNLPDIAEAAVIGVPDTICGQAIKAFVVSTSEALTETRILAHCRAHLEDFMVPKTVEFRDSLPKNASGKIDKLALAERQSSTRREGAKVLKQARSETGAPMASVLQLETQNLKLEA
jgi:long-chain acyl-CoA synthetase